MKKSIGLLTVMFLFVAMNVLATEVVFSGQVNGQFDLFRCNLEDGKIVRLTDTKADELMPSVSPDGKKIVFVSDRQGANSLYLAELNNIAAASYISAGIGAYANPVFSPDGSKIMAQYAPDPEEQFKNTKIVILDPATKSQVVVIDSKLLNVPDNSETILMVDRPVWVSESIFVYVLAEMTDEISGRITRSTLYMFDMKNRKSIRMGGGESYFTDEGRSMGFKAAMPKLIAGQQSAKVLSFVAIRGAVDRQPMSLSLSGSGKGPLAIKDQSFFGPVLYDGKTWVYGTMDNNGITGLSYLSDINEPPQRLGFPGRIIYPELISP
ncbi:MAG: hypothetical protein Kow0029_22150 [Candidatus Rifleibacteriota bacterium]